MSSKYSSDAREEQREYYRAWRAANKVRTREYQHRYWEKRAERKRGEDNAENKIDREILSESAH